MQRLSKRIVVVVLGVCLFQLSAQLPTFAMPGVTRATCDHAYLPLQPGNYWVYEDKEAPLNQRSFTLKEHTFRRDATRCGGLDCGRLEGVWIVDQVDEGIGDTVSTVFTTAEVVERSQFYSYSVPFQCDEAGLSVAQSAGTGLFRPFADDFLGVYFLHLSAEPQLTVGNFWDGDSYQDVKRGGGMSSIHETQSETYTVIARDPITINGQRYEGLQIAKTFTTTQTGCAYIAVCSDPQSKSTVKGTVNFTLARGIGIVQISSPALAGQPYHAITLVESNLVGTHMP
jgi:hypothetical protein